MREAEMVHDWSKNHFYLHFHDLIIRVDLLTDRVYFLGIRASIHNCSNKTIHSAPLKNFYICKESPNVGKNLPI